MVKPNSAANVAMMRMISSHGYSSKGDTIEILSNLQYEGSYTKGPSEPGYGIGMEDFLYRTLKGVKPWSYENT